MRWQPVLIGAGAVAVLAGAPAAAVVLTSNHPKDISHILSAPSPTPTLSATAMLPASPPPPPNPLSGARFYVDPDSKALRAARTVATDKAALLRRIGSQPQAFWYGDWVPASQLRAQVGTVVRRASASGRVPVLVTYDIPVRDCHGYSGGGATSPAAYRQWVDAFASAVDGRRAVVIVEPDALAQVDCLPPSDQQTRLELLRYTVQQLARAKTTVYLDAGHAGWVAPDTMADRLRKAGVADARGFSLNVSNFGRTDDEVAYGHAVAAALGTRTPFVIDTSRNGNGPSADNQWCNPQGRALGAPPTARTQQTDVDAFLWIKRPGESDGTCNGGPTAGQFWTDYAIGLAAHSSS
jgi:endoglucanase